MAAEGSASQRLAAGPRGFILGRGPTQAPFLQKEHPFFSMLDKGPAPLPPVSHLVGVTMVPQRFRLLPGSSSGSARLGEGQGDLSPCHLFLGFRPS